MKKLLLFLVFVFCFFFVSTNYLPCAHAQPIVHHYLITINISTNYLTLFDNQVEIHNYRVATGQIINGKSLTPTGKFTILNKIKDPYWGGGGYSKPIAGGNPKNPLGHYWLGTSAGRVPGSSIGIHGNTDYNSIGTYASHGCIRMYNTDVPQLFNLVPLKTPVWIGTSAQLTSWEIKGFK